MCWRRCYSMRTRKFSSSTSRPGLRCRAPRVAPCGRYAGGPRNQKGEKPRLVHRLDRDVRRACRCEDAPGCDEARGSRQRETKRHTGADAGVPKSARIASRPGSSRSRRRTATVCESPGTARRGPTMRFRHRVVNGRSNAVMARNGALYRPHPSASRSCG